MDTDQLFLENSRRGRHHCIRDSVVIHRLTVRFFFGGVYHVKRLLLGVCVLACLLPLLSVPMFGQAFYGSIVGTVSDPSNASLRGATVTLTNTGTQEKRQTTTSADGGFSFQNLVPATYRIDVEQSGF